MNKKISFPIAIIIIVICAAIVGGFAWQYRLIPDIGLIFIPTPKDETANWKTYSNEEYGFEIKYPLEWRTANLIMEWLVEDGRFGGQAVFTNLSETKEEEYRKATEGEIGMAIPYEYINNIYGQSIVIFPTTVAIEEYKNPKPEVGWEISNFRKEETAAGLKIFRLRETVTWEVNLDREIALIPYHGDKDLWGEKVTYIGISIKRDNDNYEKDVFEKMVSTFKFTQ